MHLSENHVSVREIDHSFDEQEGVELCLVNPYCMTHV